MTKIVHPIDAWLASPNDYWEGLKLYDTYSKRPRYPRLRHTLGFGPDAYNFKSLQDELRWVLQNDIIDSFEAEKFIAAAEPVPDPEAKPLTTADIDDHLAYNRLPEEGKALTREWKQLYSESASLHSTLPLLESDEARKEAAAKILANFSQIHVAWDRLDTFQKTGIWLTSLQGHPDPVGADGQPGEDGQPDISLHNADRPPGPQDPAAMMRRLNNLRSQVSKQKDNANRQAEVAAWRMEIESLEKALGINKTA